MILPAIALMIMGYDVAYYAVNVLIWAHARQDTTDPVPLRYCFGFAIKDPGQGTDIFSPPFKLGNGLPGYIDDARALLGGKGGMASLSPTNVTNGGTPVTSNSLNNPVGDPVTLGAIYGSHPGAVG